jgi:hypothetical protein
MRALALLCAFLLAAACLPGAALAQQKDPSALWDSFPLDPTPTPASGPRTAEPQAVTRSSDSGPSPFVLFGLMVLAAGVGGSAVVLTRSVRRGRMAAADAPVEVVAVRAQAEGDHGGEGPEGGEGGGGHPRGQRGNAGQGEAHAGAGRPPAAGA